MGKLSELLVCLKHGETIYRGINLWLELTQWVKKTAVMTDNDGSWSVHGFTKYITEQIANFVKSPSAGKLLKAYKPIYVNIIEQPSLSELLTVSHTVRRRRRSYLFSR